MSKMSIYFYPQTVKKNVLRPRAFGPQLLENGKKGGQIKAFSMQSISLNDRAYFSWFCSVIMRHYYFLVETGKNSLSV